MLNHYAREFFFLTTPCRANYAPGMPHGDDAINALRDALKHSPENLPLRLHLADTLVGLGRYEEAEREYKTVLQSAPHDPKPKLGLANAYYLGGKASPAMVVVEELTKLANP